MEKRQIKDRFLDWQCQLRQTAMRTNGGRPSEGMSPRVLDDTGGACIPALTVLLAPKAPEESTAFFRFQVMKSTDPRETYEKSLRYLQSEYYQDPKQFSDRLLATLAGDSALLDALKASGRCVLDFQQGRHSFRLPCKVKVLKDGHANRVAAIWHNRIFNPALPDSAKVLTFKPDWDKAEMNLQAAPG